MTTPYAPVDVGRLGHRYQAILAHATTGKEIVADRVQRAEHSIRKQTEVYYELGNTDPVGYAEDAPEFRSTLEENVHNCELDLLLAGKDPAVDTSWNIVNYIQNGVVTMYLLERDSATGAIAGEIEIDNNVVSEIQWQWRMGQPIVATYTLEGRAGKHWLAASTPHGSWGVGDLVSPGGIKLKDARLFMGGNDAGSRMYRLQGFTLRVTFASTVVREAGNRNLVGNVVAPPSTTLDIDLLAADMQPDDYLYRPQPGPSSYTYYDYTDALVQTNSAIRIYDPAQAEGASVLRAFLIEKLVPGDAQPALVSTRGLASKRYPFMVPAVVTANSGGVKLFSGDIV